MDVKSVKSVLLKSCGLYLISCVIVEVVLQEHGVIMLKPALKKLKIVPYTF